MPTDAQMASLLYLGLFVQITKSRPRYVLCSISWLHTTPASHSAMFERVNDSTFVILADDIAKSCRYVSSVAVLSREQQPTTPCLQRRGLFGTRILAYTSEKTCI